MAVTIAEPDTPGRNTVARERDDMDSSVNTGSGSGSGSGSAATSPVRVASLGKSGKLKILTDNRDTRTPDFRSNGQYTPSTTASTTGSAGTPFSSSSSSSVSRQFYAVRKGRGVAHCIFSSWDHAKQHVENFRDAIYNVFDNMDDAMLYIQLPSHQNHHHHHHHHQRRHSTSSSSTSSTLSNSNNNSNNNSSKRKRTATLPFNNHNHNDSKKSRAALPLTTTNNNKNNSSSDKENQVANNTATKRNNARKQTHVAVDAQVAVTNQEEDQASLEEDDRELPQILEEGYRKNLPKGWRANDLFPARRQDRLRWEKRYLQDVASLKAYRATKPSSARDVHNMRHQSGIPNAFSLAYLNWSWGVGEAYHRYLAFQQRKNKPETTKHRTKNNKLKVAPANRSNHYSCSTCVITNREAARKRFTAKAMFYSFRVQQLAELSVTGLRKDQLPGRMSSNDLERKSPLVNGCSRSKELMDEARADWETLSSEDKAFWEEQEQEHDARQPEIRSILEAALQKDPKRSAKKLSEDIGHWCGKTTIGKWKGLYLGPSYRKGISNPQTAEISVDLTDSGTTTRGSATPLAPLSLANNTRNYSPPHISAAKLLVGLPDANSGNPFGSDDDGDSCQDGEEPSPARCASHGTTRTTTMGCNEGMIASYEDDDDDDNMVI